MTPFHHQVIFLSPQKQFQGEGLAVEQGKGSACTWSCGDTIEIFLSVKHCLLIQTLGTCSQQYAFEFQLWLTQLWEGSVAVFLWSHSFWLSFLRRVWTESWFVRGDCLDTILEILKLVDRNNKMAGSDTEFKGPRWEDDGGKRVCHVPWAGGPGSCLIQCFSL